MSVNNAENNLIYALSNELQQLRRNFNDFRSTPQPIGNGSINYAVFTGFTIGPATIAAGAKAHFSVMFMDIGSPFTYDGRPAINRRTFLDVFLDPFVDVNDEAHMYPDGALLTAGQKRLTLEGPWKSMQYSGLEETNGQQLVRFAIRNDDTVAHNYYLQGTALIPRPALKPQ